MRLFVAINFPDEVRRAIWNAAAALRLDSIPVRWVRADGIHLTLKFLGDVARDREPQVAEAIEAAVEGTKPFVLRAGGFGAFPPRSRPRVVWLGCERSPPLEILQHRLEVGLETVGFPLEVRTFAPHLTLGRVRRGGSPTDFKRLRTVIDSLDFSTETLVEHADLVESTLGAAGPKYDVRRAFGFRP